MSAHFFTGSFTSFVKGRFHESCTSLIVYDGDPEASRQAFEQWLQRHQDADTPVPTKVEKVVGAPLAPRMLTETGEEEIDWVAVEAAVHQTLEGSGEDDFAQGFWVDPDQYVLPGRLSSGIERLKEELPEDLQTGLNWSPEKNYYFLISVLTRPKTYEELVQEEDEGLGLRETAAPAAEEDFQRVFGDGESAFPQLVEKEAAALVKARNALVAAWLWRKHGAGSSLEQHPIRIDAWCGANSVEQLTHGGG